MIGHEEERSCEFDGVKTYDRYQIRSACVHRAARKNLFAFSEILTPFFFENIEQPSSEMNTTVYFVHVTGDF